MKTLTDIPDNCLNIIIDFLTPDRTSLIEEDCYESLYMYDKNEYLLFEKLPESYYDIVNLGCVNKSLRNSAKNKTDSFKPIVQKYLKDDTGLNYIPLKCYFKIKVMKNQYGHCCDTCVDRMYSDIEYDSII